MKILLSCHLNLGDLIMCTSVLPVLKSAFPQCQIGFLFKKESLPVVEEHQYIDWIHCLECPEFEFSPEEREDKMAQASRAWHQAKKEISNIKYDVAVDLRYFSNPRFRPTPNDLINEVGIPERFGYMNISTTRDFNRRIVWDVSSLHMVENHGMMMRALGVSEEHMALLHPCLLYQKEYKAVLPCSGKYIVIHMGSSDPRREWSLASWKKLLLSLDQIGLPLVFIGSGERMKQAIAKVIPTLSNGINRCDHYSWKELIPVIRSAEILIGVESMAGHMAAALNIPAVLIYGGLTPVFRWRPYNDCCLVINPDVEQRSALIPNDDITPNSVLEKISEVLSKKGIAAPRNTPICNAAELDLAFFEKHVSSRYGGDGVIEKIFSVIGVTQKRYVDIDALSGYVCNTCYLREKCGWTGVMFDQDYENEEIALYKTQVTIENVNPLLEHHNVPEELDLLSFSGGFNDFHLWREISSQYRPRVVVIGYNATHPPTEDRVVSYDPEGFTDATHYFGASILALYRLGRSKGYSLVYADSRGADLYFIRDDILAHSDIKFKHCNQPELLYHAPAVYRPYGRFATDHLQRPYLESLEF